MPRGSGRGGTSIWAAPEKKKDSGSFLGALTHSAPFKLGTNLVTDVKDAVVGIPTGLVMLATHPVDTVEQIGVSKIGRAHV